MVSGGGWVWGFLGVGVGLGVCYLPGCAGHLPGPRRAPLEDRHTALLLSQAIGQPWGRGGAGGGGGGRGEGTTAEPMSVEQMRSSCSSL